MLEVPPMPEALAYLWNAFWRIRVRKGTDAMGNVQPIGWGDLDAFNRLSGLKLNPWEIDLIEQIDTVYLQARAKVLREG